MFIPTASNNFGNAFANGQTVTQEIADYCASNGHGTWTIDGVESTNCPRCGESTVNEVITEDYINNVLTSAGTTVPLNADDNAHVVAKVTGYIRALYVEHLGEFTERDIIEYAVDYAQDIIVDTPEIVLPEHADIIVDTYLELSKVTDLDERSSKTATSPKRIVEIAEYYLASADSY